MSVCVLGLFVSIMKDSVHFYITVSLFFKMIFMWSCVGGTGVYHGIYVES